jgi:hypothetical protein
MATIRRGRHRNVFTNSFYFLERFEREREWRWRWRVRRRRRKRLRPGIPQGPKTVTDASRALSGADGGVGYACWMSKGDGSARANLRATRAQINNASASAQTRAFKARQVAKQKRDAEERKLRAMQAARKDAKADKDAKAVATAPSSTTTAEVSAERAGEDAEPIASTE